MKRFAIICLLASTAASAGARNLLLNPSFEYSAQPQNWGHTWGTFIIESWNTPPDGIFAAYIRGNWCKAGTGGGCMQSVANIVGGATYRLRAYFYMDNGWTAQKKAVKLEFYNDAGTKLSGATNTLAELQNHAWIRMSVQAVAPPETARAQVIIEASGISGPGVLGVDLVELEAVDPDRPEPAASISPKP